MLRSAAVVALAGLALDVLGGSGPAGPTVLEARSGREAALVDALLAPVPPHRVVWTDRAGPDARAAWLLSPGPAAPVLTLPVGPVPGLRVEPPARAVAGWAAALRVEVVGAPGDTVVIRHADALGAVDSVAVPLDSTGRGTAGLGVRPAREGWQAWTVSAGPDSVRVGVWALPPRPLRVLALVGTPDPESRFALRALEEAGASVEARVELGRVDALSGSDWSADALDVVALLGSPPLTAADRAGLESFVAGGGGVVVAPRAGDPDGGGALPAAWGMDAARPGPTLPAGSAPTWTLPAELSPLPSAPTDVRTVVLDAPLAATAVATSPEGRTVAALMQPGGGRVAWVGLAESWRWRMEGGAVGAHRAWWRGWAEWAAQGLRQGVVVAGPGEVLGGQVAVFRLETVRPDARLPSRVAVTRPGGAVDSVDVVIDVREGGEPRYDGTSARVRFLAPTPGAYRVSWDGHETGLQAADRVAEPDPADRSLLALASSRPERPGRPVPPGTDPTEGAASREGPWGGSTGPGPWWGGLLAVLLAAEWAVRRWRGGP